MKKPRSLLILGLALGFALALRFGWLQQGFSTKQQAIARGAWFRVELLAAQRGLEGVVVEPLNELVAGWREAADSRALASSDEPHSALLAERATALMAVVDEYPSCALDEGEGLSALCEVALAAVRAADADAARIASLVRLAQRLQTRAGLLNFTGGIGIQRAILERCAQDPQLVGELSELVPPRADELFFAVCRDVCSSAQLVAQSLPAGQPGAPGSSGAPRASEQRAQEFVALAARAALTDLIGRLEPLKDAPASWAALKETAAALWITPGWILLAMYSSGMKIRTSASV